MGSGNSRFETIPFENGELVLPIPKNIMSSRNPGDPNYKHFTQFVNNAKAIQLVTNFGRNNNLVLVPKVMSLFFRSGCCSDTVYPEPVGVIVTNGGTTLRLLQPDGQMYAYGDSVMDNMFRKMSQFCKTNSRKHSTIVVWISLDGVHANVAIIRYYPDTMFFRTLLFEPHLKRSIELESTFRDFLGRLVRVHGGGQFSLTIPHSELALQGGSPVCVQWVMIICTMYLINCKDESDMCGNIYTDPGNVINALQRRRNEIVPVWMYMMYQIIRRKNPKDLFNLQRAAVVKPTKKKLEGFVPLRSEVDFHQCDLRNRSDCTSPCEYDVKQGCINSNLYAVKDPLSGASEHEIKLHENLLGARKEHHEQLLQEHSKKRKRDIPELVETKRSRFTEEPESYSDWEEYMNEMDPDNF